MRLSPETPGCIRRVPVVACFARCRAIGEATGMPLIDPTLTSLLQRSAFWPMREIPALKSAILDANSEAFSCEHRMKRRDFIMLVGGAMVCPYGGTAQRPTGCLQ